MKSPEGEFVLVVAGRPIEDAWNRVRRYCGLPWGDGSPETWAYRFYDAIDTDTGAVTPVDVLAAGALHPGLSREDLSYFWDNAARLSEWLDEFPPDLTLATADQASIDQLGELARWGAGPSLSLITKVLHRKRPDLIPLIDREMIDWFRPVTGERRAVAAWLPMLGQLGEDLRRNAGSLNRMTSLLEIELGRTLAPVRLVDIAVWMGSQR